MTIFLSYWFIVPAIAFLYAVIIAEAFKMNPLPLLTMAFVYSAWHNPSYFAGFWLIWLIVKFAVYMLRRESRVGVFDPKALEKLK